MVFNNDSTGNDLCTIADDYAGTSDLTFPLEKKARAANKVTKLIWTWIYKAYGGWQYDNSSNTTLPIALANIQLGQTDYDIPQGAKTIRGVDVLPSATATVYQPLILITEEEIRDMGYSEASFQSTTTGTPKYYRPIGDSFKVYPAANYSVTNGMQVSVDRNDNVYTATGNDTLEPGFDANYHEAVGVGMALEYAKINHLSSATDLQGDMDSYKEAITKDYSSRLQQKYPARMTARDEVAEYL
jgi:hypothetical protein